MSTLLPGTPFFIQVFYHTPFILTHTLLSVHSMCAKKSLLTMLKQIINTSFHATHGTVLSPSRVSFLFIFWFRCLLRLTVRIQTDSPRYYIVYAKVAYYIAHVILVGVLSLHLNILRIWLYTFLCTLISRESLKKTDVKLKILLSVIIL